MRKIGILMVISACAALTACNTAYNGAGRSWVKTKTAHTMVQNHKSVAKTPAVEPVKSITSGTVTDNSNTLTASIANVSINKTAYKTRPVTQPVTVLSVAKSKTAKTAKSAALAPYGEPKCSQRTAFYLSLPPFGIFGFHRYYLGFFWIGVLQTVTFGGLGIWTIIDIIRIYNGDLAAKDHYIYRRTWFN